MVKRSMVATMNYLFWSTKFSSPFMKSLTDCLTPCERGIKVELMMNIPIDLTAWPNPAPTSDIVPKCAMRATRRPNIPMNIPNWT